MSRILFIQDIGYEHIGTMYLAAVLKQHNHQCDLLIDNLEKDIIEKARVYQPDLIGLSVVTGTQQWSLDMAKRMKSAFDCRIILGGPHPTYFPEIIQYEQVDYICRGEGEYALLELAEAIKQDRDTSGIRNIWCKRGGEIVKNEVRDLIGDLDTLPFPDRSIYYKYPSIRRMPQKRFMATRGCPYNCSFCFNRALRLLYREKGNYVRRRSVKNVIDEIINIKSKYFVKTVYFEDDTFTLDYKWIFEFLREYRKKVNLPFICLLRANLVTEALISEFKISGCKRVFFGVETGNEKIRNDLLEKDLSNEDIINAARILHKYKIGFKTYNMLGLPDETIETALETLKLNAEIKTDYPWCSIFQPYPSTELGEYTIQRGYLAKGFSCNDILPYYSRSMLVNKAEIKQIINLQRFFTVGIKFPFLIPLIKKIIKLPPNIIFDFVFILGHAYTYVGSEDISILNSFAEGIKSIRKLYFLKK
jgi:anaerobic magnesium-protoporphyrin IX monomethyl ester cyclase